MNEPPNHQTLNHAVYGNGRVLALVCPTSAIEWLCMPRFDSPSVFGRILDAEKGGTFRIDHASGTCTGQMGYVANTNVVRTVFERGEERWEVIDFAPRIPAGLGVRVPIEIARLVRPIAGEPRLVVEFDPRPDYDRAVPRIRQNTNGLSVTGFGTPLHLATSVPTPYITSRTPFVLTRPHWFVLSYGTRDSLPTLASVRHDLDRTVAGWRQWARSCALPFFAPELVLRSALCLKLHAYHDTGAIVAATTTSIPEAMGTPRTWDYRYCWLRDAALTVASLSRLGSHHEALAFLDWLAAVVDRRGADRLQPLYTVTGDELGVEAEIGELSGYRASRPCGWGTPPPGRCSSTCSDRWWTSWPSWCTTRPR